jgi:hypothetical protein
MGRWGGMALGGFFFSLFFSLFVMGRVPCSADCYFCGGGTSPGNEMGGDGLIELGEGKLGGKAGEATGMGCGALGA